MKHNVSQVGLTLATCIGLFVAAPPIPRSVIRLVLYLAKYLGLFRLARRLTGCGLRIICYHGFAVGEEYKYRSTLFIRDEFFRKRMEYLRREGYPIFFAPTRANQFANNQVEGFMRRQRDAGAAVEFGVTYATFSGEELRPFITRMLNSGDPKILGRLALDQGLIEKFLKAIREQVLESSQIEDDERNQSQFIAVCDRLENVRSNVSGLHAHALARSRASAEIGRLSRAS